MIRTILSNLVENLEGWGDKPTWEIVSYEQKEKDIYLLSVKLYGTLDRGTELEDLVSKLSCYGYFNVLSAIKNNDKWNITVTKNNEIKKETV